jgi:hypothetical protein
VSKSVPPAVEKHDALFRVLAQKSIACLKIKAASQPPATSTRTQPSRPKSIQRQPPTPPTDISQFNDKVSHDTARRRRRRLLVGTGGKARPGGASTNKYSKQTSHQTYSTRRNHTNEISGPVLLKHDTNDLSRPTDHEFTTLIIARSMLPCTIEFS